MNWWHWHIADHAATLVTMAIGGDFRENFVRPTKFTNLNQRSSWCSWCRISSFPVERDDEQRIWSHLATSHSVFGPVNFAARIFQHARSALLVLLLVELIGTAKREKSIRFIGGDLFTRRISSKPKAANLFEFHQHHQMQFILWIA